MNRSQLVDRIKGNSDLPAGEVDWFVRTFFDSLVTGMIEEGRVELRGFGVFDVKTRRQAEFTNPKNKRVYPGGNINVVQFTSTGKARGWEDVDPGARDQDPEAGG